MITTYQQAAFILAAIAFILAYLITGKLGPLDITIRALLHLQAGLLGVRIETALAVRRVVRRHPVRLAIVQKELEFAE